MRTLRNDRIQNATLFLVLGGWLLLYGWRAVANHLALRTNAYDLSVFDYAIWDLARGGHGWVPFFGSSLFSDHWMPILYLVVPLYWLAPNPLVLILLQPILTAIAGVLFFRVMKSWGLPFWLSLSVLVLFLFARRTHGALGGYFYPEVAQCLLIFAVVLLWRARPVLLWPCVILLLMTKEDGAIYLAGLSLFALVRDLGSRRRALAVLATAVVWFAVALTVAMPVVRRIDGLGPQSSLLHARYGSAEGGPSIWSISNHLFSSTSANTLGNLVLSTGLLAIAGPEWLAPALPGLLANLAAKPDTLQAALKQHYAWPILPWLFLAAALGAHRIYKRSQRAATVCMALVVVITVADNPAVQRVMSTSVSSDARLVREELRQVRGHTIAAQPNLIPHLTKSRDIVALNNQFPSARDPDLILLTFVGDLWPFTQQEVAALVEKYRADKRYVEVKSGPLYAFQLVTRCP